MIHILDVCAKQNVNSTWILGSNLNIDLSNYSTVLNSKTTIVHVLIISRHLVNSTGSCVECRFCG